jgi:hypothetical protein
MEQNGILEFQKLTELGNWGFDSPPFFLIPFCCSVLNTQSVFARNLLRRGRCVVA